jgi:hypothetical protein
MAAFGAFGCSLTALVACCTMNWVRALSSAVRAFGLHPKGRPFKSDSAHHCDATSFSGDVVQLVRTLPRPTHCHGRFRSFFDKIRQQQRRIPLSARTRVLESPGNNHGYRETDPLRARANRGCGGIGYIGVRDADHIRTVRINLNLYLRIVGRPIIPQDGNSGRLSNDIYCLWG